MSDHPASAASLQSDLSAQFRGPLIAFFSRRIKDRREAEDLAQEVLLRVLSTDRRRIEHAANFVFKVAINLLRDQRRRQLRAGLPGFVRLDDTAGPELEGEFAQTLSPERILSSRSSLEDVVRTLDELGERTRNIFVLFRLEKMKHKDIAERYGISISSVEKHVMRASLHLASRYGRQPEVTQQ
ncbi:RNA polymerase sigma factor [Peristeroidobacter soli]|jgi:RNA polymerase sigma-70 factor (ECF subfamily)|uniref:RNA polymerase sigma factor n=1 Tax=Peristeroidobacter soli TaxID=2497877 RepID=UPI00101D08EB|nr:sigma-70 family RNA polymerase sigma factor [Peristeroidobacter soli]